MHIARKVKSKTIFRAALSLLLALSLTACSAPGAVFSPNAPQRVSRSALLLDTVVTITLYGDSDETLIDRCFDLCRDYEAVFSRTDEGSELYALNQTGSLEASPALLELTEKALYYCRLSGGAFDITMGAVSEMYAFTSDAPRAPSRAELDEALRHVGYQGVEVDGKTITLADPQAVVDLGAIAKGYIADRLGEFLLENGQESALINLGGNVLCVGSKPDGSDFIVGLQYPFEETSKTIAEIRVSGCSVVTSGVYERFFEQDGVFYHHILDPQTGLPYDNGLLAVSIVSPCSVDGDALSTVCFALGLEKGLELINSMENVCAVFVTDDFELHYSEGFEALLA